MAGALGIVRKPLAWMMAGGLLLVFTASSFAYGVHLENNDHFCARCHTEPESTYVSRTEQPAVDLASAHAAKAVKCIQCHSGAGTEGRLRAMMLGARDLTAYLGHHYPQPATLTHPITDAHCLKCHQDVLRTRTFENHFHALLPQWHQVAPSSAATCVSCHTAHTTDGDPRLGWLNKARTVARCNACHRIAGE
ncbi:MAG: hypothetical protein D6759_07190 [Chloroflexi bacterium]|nr:MAG: hypothetical protein D6759_07190 [Chloroflexota bacterium]